MYKKIFKRLFDLIIATLIIIFSSVIWMIVIALLFVANRGSVFFTQKRIGRNNLEFKIIKFKSMNDRKDADGNLLRDVERLTSVGQFIRKTSLDELPQLINVLKGEMSIIGPRPLLPEYLPYYNDVHIRRHEVRPGLTGLAQISGRNTLTFGQRFDLDVEYVNDVSLKKDIYIFYKTILKVIKPQKDIQLGVRSMSEIDDIGITKGLASHYFNVRDDEK